MPADDDIGFRELFGQLYFVLKAHVGEQNQNVTLLAQVSIIAGCFKRRAELECLYLIGMSIRHAVVTNLDQPEYADADSVAFKDVIGLQIQRLLRGAFDVGTDKGKFGEIQAVAQRFHSTVELMVAERGEIEAEAVHELNHRGSGVLTAVHIGAAGAVVTGRQKQQIRVLGSFCFQAACQLRQVVHIGVHVVDAQDGDLCCQGIAQHGQ